jgi:DNA-binding transcriptional LysR family regulator
MNPMHFAAFDLNLLRLFNALIEEGGATRAGARLGLTQSAVSHALGRLRVALGDPLFVRGPTGLHPTPRAMELAPAIRQALELLEGVITSPRFDPAVDARAFTVATSPYVSSVLLPTVVQRILDEAPKVTLRISGLTSTLTEDIDRGRIDVVLGCFEAIPPRFQHTPLFEETGVWAVRAGHPAVASGMTAESLARIQHLVVSSADATPAGEGPSRPGLGLKRVTSWSEDYALGSADLRPKPGPISVPDAYSAIMVVAQTDMAALLPRRLAMQAAERGKVVIIEPAHTPEPTLFSAVSMGDQSPTGPVSWLLDVLKQAAADV